jgi:hypothetical protein
MKSEIEDLENSSRTLVVFSTNITNAQQETTSGEWVNYVSDSRPGGSNT